jgi:hypothetical protein
MYTNYFLIHVTCRAGSSYKKDKYFFDGDRKRVAIYAKVMEVCVYIYMICTVVAGRTTARPGYSKFKFGMQKSADNASWDYNVM